MSANNYYSYDACYAKPTSVSDVSFQRNLRDNFYQIKVSSVNECEKQAFKTNSNFFLINDINSTLSKINTNCYIPRTNDTDSSLFGADSILTKSKELFDSLFFKNNIYITQEPNPIDTCNNLMYNHATKKCFKYSLDGQTYTRDPYYARYKRPILNNANISIINMLRRPDDYKTTALLTSLKSYEDLLKIDEVNFQAGSGPLTNAFHTFICDPTSDTESELDTQIVNLKQKYTNLYFYLDKITYDLSAISYLNKFDDDTIRAINFNIATKSKELSNFLSSAGANNGRLDDTTLLTQFKIVENSILLLLIISIIFYFTKIKKSI